MQKKKEKKNLICALNNFLLIKLIKKNCMIYYIFVGTLHMMEEEANGIFLITCQYKNNDNVSHQVIKNNK